MGKYKVHRCRVDGVEYDSARIAAKHLGMKMQDVYLRLKSSEHPNYEYLEQVERYEWERKRKAKPTFLTDTEKDKQQ